MSDLHEVDLIISEVVRCLTCTRLMKTKKWCMMSASSWLSVHRMRVSQCYSQDHTRERQGFSSGAAKPMTVAPKPRAPGLTMVARSPLYRGDTNCKRLLGLILGLSQYRIRVHT